MKAEIKLAVGCPNCHAEALVKQGQPKAYCKRCGNEWSLAKRPRLMLLKRVA